MTETTEERKSVPGADPIRAAMERAPEVEWLTQEQRAESDAALDRKRSGLADLIAAGKLRRACWTRRERRTVARRGIRGRRGALSVPKLKPFSLLAQEPRP